MHKVLVVENDENQCEELASALADEYDVQKARGGWDAMRILRKQSFDAVLLDLYMRDGDGFTVMGSLMSLQNKPGIIVHSIRTEARTVVAAMKMGATNYLIKPCSPSRVKAAIEDSIGRSNISGEKLTKSGVA